MSDDPSIETKQTPQRSTHFTFEHPVFATPSPRFLITSDGEPSFQFLLGELDAAIPIRALRLEFDLDKTPDGPLLDQVVAGLKFVRVIRPGDSIPRELLDGSASWSVEPRHLEIAKGRITLQISSWLTGAETVIVDHDALLQLAEDPAVKQRVNGAFADIAVKVGLTADQKQEIIDRIEQLSRELAYIEALRERLGAIKMINEKVGRLETLYRRDRSMAEELGRIMKLIRRPIAELENIFDQIDGMCGEIISLLRNIVRQIEFIREGRDEIHHRMMLWDDIIERFTKVEIERSPANELEIKELYRFAARNFLVERSWELMSSAFTRQADKA